MKIKVNIHDRKLPFKIYKKKHFYFLFGINGQELR